LAHAIPARLSAADGRRFGVQVGLAFVVLATIAWWRGRTGIAPWLGGIGGVLTLAGLLIPGSLGPVYRAWMGLAVLLSKVTTPIFMGVIYFVVITPIGLVMRAIGRSPLPRGGNWHERSAEPPDRLRMERQF